MKNKNFKFSKIFLYFYLGILEIRRIFFGKKYQAEFDITDNCNLDCKHCYHFKKYDKGSTKKEIILDVWEKRFDDLYDDGIRLVLLSGGEPTLRQDIIRLACEKFISVRLITNGQIKISQKFKNLVIFLSLDGDKEKNDEIRGEGVFNKAINNYSGDNRVIINASLMRDNFIDLEKIIKISQKNCFRGVVCNFYNNNGNNNDPLTLNEEERNVIIKELRRIKKLYVKDLLLTKPMINWYAEPNHSGRCYWGDEVLHFSSSWEERRCFVGLNCNNCGCFAGALQGPFSLFFYPREAFKFI